MADVTPSYAFFETATWDAWVAALGFAAASKLAGACMTYFFHGELGDDVKLTKAAAALFEGERAKLDAKRAKIAAKGSATKDADKGAKPATATTKDRRTKQAKPVPANVEKSDGAGKSSKKSQKSSGKVTEKSPKNLVVAHASTCENEKSRLAPIINLNLSNIPQTPTAKGKAVGSGVMSRDEYERLMADGLGFGSPTAYGMGDAAVVGG